MNIAPTPVLHHHHHDARLISWTRGRGVCFCCCVLFFWGCVASRPGLQIGLFAGVIGLMCSDGPIRPIKSVNRPIFTRALGRAGVGRGGAGALITRGASSPRAMMMTVVVVVMVVVMVMVMVMAMVMTMTTKMAMVMRIKMMRMPARVEYNQIGAPRSAIAKIHATWQSNRWLGLAGSARCRWIGLAGSARRQATSCPRATRTRSCPLWPEWSLCCRRACLLRLHRCKSTLPYAPLNSIERRHHL